jgi:hypothetical protein
MLYACSKYGANTETLKIDAEAALWAAEFVRWNSNLIIEWAADSVTNGQFDADQMRIYRYIKKKGTVTLNDICNRFKEFKSKGRQEILHNLIEANLIYFEVVESERRPFTIYYPKNISDKNNR